MSTAQNYAEIDPVDADGDVPLTLAEYRSIHEEIDAQPRAWRRTADREMDYADGNQLETELIRHMKSQGIPVVRENLIAGSLEGIRGYEIHAHGLARDPEWSAWRPGCGRRHQLQAE